jgi:hypothetical protein
VWRRWFGHWWDETPTTASLRTRPNFATKFVQSIEVGRFIIIM